ncbi:hypothetical protein HZY88_02230 [Aerococcaceae bacterium DSM 111176]|nr:hypothetical protein [Aerococcaceae bacterium DSM 111176]
MKKFDQEHELLEDMYRDDYYPKFLVDKIRSLIENVIVYLEQSETDLVKIQEKFDEMTLGINDLAAEFDENDSDLETNARESIGESVRHILNWFDIDIDIEEAIREREW